MRGITRNELIQWLVDTDIFEQKIKPVSENQLTVTKLAKLLNTDPKTIRDYRDGKRSKTLTEWSRDKTIDGKAWDYDPATKRYFQLD